MALKSPQNREKGRLTSFLGNQLEKGTQNVFKKKEPPEDEKSNIFDGGLFEITLSVNCNNVKKRTPGSTNLERFLESKSASDRRISFSKSIQFN